MKCNVVYNDNGNIDKVYAANGNESILFESLQRASNSATEALEEYKKIFTPDFKERFGNFEKETSDRVDENGEPVLQSGLFFQGISPEDKMYLSGKEPKEELSLEDIRVPLAQEEELLKDTIQKSRKDIILSEDEKSYEVDGTPLNRVTDILTTAFSWRNKYKDPSKAMENGIELAAKATWKKLAKKEDEKAETEFGNLSFEEYKQHFKWKVYMKGIYIGNAIHYTLQSAIDPSTEAQNKQRIAKMSQELNSEVDNEGKPKPVVDTTITVGKSIKNIFDYQWVANNHRKILDAMGVYTDEDIYSEVPVAFPELGIAGTIDVAWKNRGGGYGISDVKSGKRFFGGVTNQIMKFGDQETNVRDTQVNRAQLQVMLYAVMLKRQLDSNSGEGTKATFDTLNITHIREEEALPAMERNGLSINVRTMLPMVEQWMRNTLSKEQLDELLEVSPDIFSLTSYGVHNKATVVNGKAINIEQDILERLAGEFGNSTNEMIASLMDELIVLNHKYKKGGTTSGLETGKMDKKDRDRALILKKQIDILEKHADEQLELNAEDSAGMIWFKNQYDFSDDYMRYFGRLWQRAKVKANRTIHTRERALDKVMEPYIRNVLGISKGRSRTASMINYSVAFDNLYKKAEVNGTLQLRLKHEGDKEWKNLKKEEQDLLTYMNNMFEEYFYSKEYLSKRASVSEKGYSQTFLDLYNNAKAATGGAKFKYYRGWFPKTQKTKSEQRYDNTGLGGIGADTIGRFGKKAILRKISESMTYMYEDVWESESDKTMYIPIKYLGSASMARGTTDSKGRDIYQFTKNPEIFFGKFVDMAEKKKEMEGVYAYGKVLMRHYDLEKHRLNQINQNRNLPTNEKMFKGQKKYLEDVLEENIRGVAIRENWQKNNFTVQGKEVSFDKMVKSLNNWASTSIMYLKPITGTFNGILAGLVQGRRALSADIASKVWGEFDKDKAVEYTSKEYALATRDWGTYVMDFVKGDLKNNKMWLLAKHLDYFTNSYKSERLLETMRSKIAASDTGYLMHSIPEEAVQLITMAAQLRHIKFKRKSDGKEMSAWDAYEVNKEKGLIEWKGGVRFIAKKGDRYEEITDLTVDEINKLKRTLDKVQGEYRDEARIAMHYGILGKLMVTLVRYFPTLLKNLIESKKMDDTLGTWVKVPQRKEGEDIYEWTRRQREGLARLFFNRLFYVVANPLTGGKWSKLNHQYNSKALSDYQKLQLTEAWTTILTGVTALAAWSTIFADTDEDDTIKRLVRRYLVDNLSQQWNPWDIARSINNFWKPAVVTKVWKALGGYAQFFTALAYLGSGKEEDSYVKGGKERAFGGIRGLRGWKDVAKSLPSTWGKFIYAVEDLIGKMEKDKTGESGSWFLGTKYKK